jgi:hypothetical protein
LDSATQQLKKANDLIDGRLPSESVQAICTFRPPPELRFPDNIWMKVELQQTDLEFLLLREYFLSTSAGGVP